MSRKVCLLLLSFFSACSYGSDAHIAMDHASHDMQNMIVERETKDSQALSDLVDIRLEPRFVLESVNGSKTSENDFAGRYLLIGFGFTHCGHVCPTLLSNWANAVSELSETQRENLQVIFISLDPQRDTPAITDEYSKQFDSDFIGLSGTPEQVAATAENFRISYVTVPLNGGNYKVDHTSISYLVSPEREIAALIGFGTSPTEIAERIAAIIP
ncbi:MAG: SCO family protein [Halioglobus sp.]